MTYRVLLLTGSAPPEPCGIGAYTATLANALEKAGQPTEVMCHSSWSLSGTSAAFRRLLAQRDCIVHVQYPTMGYGYSLGPQVCAIARKCVVTLHEFSIAHRLRQLSLVPFTLRSARVVMTSNFERDALVRWMPWVRERLIVIPIGSNIPELSGATEERCKRIAYFGLIMPRKGLETFIEFARIVRTMMPDWELMAIGMIAPRQEEYAKGVIDGSRDSGIKWVLDRNSEEVAEMLSKTSVCYLPFPDGASERRGSLKAACLAGVPCITTRSLRTPRELMDVVTFANSPQEAATMAKNLTEQREEWSRLSRKARAYAQQFDWQTIAQSHLRMYAELRENRSNAFSLGAQMSDGNVKRVAQ